MISPKPPRKTALQTLLSDFSIEITCKEAATIEDFRQHLPIGTEVYIVATPSTQPDEVVYLAHRLRYEKMIPVPHVVARTSPSVDVIDRWLHRLNSEAGVTAALIIAGGNNAKAVGSLLSSMDLVKSGVLENNGVKDLRFAGHPEGHPMIGDVELMNVLLEKQYYGEQKGLKTSLVTQFFFDFSVMVAWEKRLLDSGIHLPIKLGFHGVASLPSLIRQARYCGVGASVGVLTKQPAKILKMTTSTTPNQLIHAWAKHTAEFKDTLFVGSHFFPLGNFEKTAAWILANS